MQSLSPHKSLAFDTPGRIHPCMAHVAVNLVSHECLPSSKSKRDPFPSYGRGGSGNIRRSCISGKSDQSDDPSVTLAPECQGTSTVDQMRPAAQPVRSESATERHSPEQTHFISSGRGGSGNIQLSASGLEAYPLTASILSQHNALQAQYEQWVRKLHADSNVVRSSGRGGSGNIRRRSHSQAPGTTPTGKKGFFTIKGRERNAGYVAEARQNGNMNRRSRVTTCSSGGSSALEARNSEDSRVSNAMTSNNSATSDPSEDVISAHSGQRLSFLRRWSNLSASSMSPATPAPPESPRSQPAMPTTPRSWHSDSSSRVYSFTSAALQNGEYVSFLEL